MKHALLLLLIIFSIPANAKKDYGYPFDKRTGKITFQNTVELKENKSALFRRIRNFIVSQNYDRTENVRCKDKSNTEVQIVDEPISLVDSVDGVYIGNGFFNFSYRGRERFLITFTYKIRADEGSYSYKMTDFKVLEFVTAPKEKGKFKGRRGEFRSKGTGFVEFSASDVRKYDLEDFIDRASYEESSSIFEDDVKDFKHQLKTILAGGL